MVYAKKMGSRKSGGDMQLTGGCMKGKSCADGVTRAKYSAVVTFPVGFAYNRKSPKSKGK